MGKSITALICNYNYGEWLAQSIMSVVNSDYEDKHICVVDDASTDNSKEVINDLFEEEDSYEFGPQLVRTGKISGVPSTVILKSDNEGPSAARNIGIDRTLHLTDYYLILDADDEIYSNKMTVLASEMNKAPNMVGVVYADYDIFNVDTGLTFTEYKESFRPQRLIQECIVHSGSLINKDALIAVKDKFGFYDREMRTCEDYDLWIRISDIFNIVHVAETLTKVRTHNNNSTNTVDNDVWRKNWSRIREKLQGRI